MAQVLVWWDSDGPAGRVRFIDIDPTWTKEEIYGRFKGAYSGDRDHISNVAVMDAATLPADRRWAKAWVFNAGNIVVSMARAKALARDIVKGEWQFVAPALRSKKAYAQATADTADDAAVQAEIDQWTAIRNSDAIQNAATTADLQTVIDQVRTLSAPYKQEN